MAQSAEAVMREMRGARRKNRGEHRDWIDTWYELWIRGFFAIVLIVVVPIILNGDKLGGRALVHFRADAPGVASIVVAAGMWVALRAGSAGAPLAPEAADVVYLLLAPVRRASVLRPLAVHQLRTVITMGIVLGAATGLATANRLPPGPGAWALGGLLAGPCLAAVLWASVAVASARRMAPLVVNGIGIVLVGGAVVDAMHHTWIAPSTWVAGLALVPIHGLVPAAAVIAGVVLTIALPTAALIAIGGTSLEPLVQRSALTSQMRFAASLQDMRTVVLLHRQLSMEKSRRRPWIPIPNRRRIRRPVWRRGWHGYARWPIDRVVRVVTLLAVGGALAYAARSTHLLIVLAGAALFVAALDMIEPYAAELDHPTALLTYGVSIRMLLMRNLAAPVAALVGCALVGASAYGVFVGHHTAVVFVCAVSAALGALAGSTLNVTLGPPPASQIAMLLISPDIYGLVLWFRQGFPPALAIAGLAPIAVASTVSTPAPPFVVAFFVSVMSVCVLLYSSLRGV